MGVPNIWVMDIIGPAILLMLLVWLVIRAPSGRSGSEEQGSQENSPDFDHGEQQRRTDGIESL